VEIVNTISDRMMDIAMQDFAAEMKTAKIMGCQFFVMIRVMSGRKKMWEKQMKLSNLCDEALQEIAKMKTKKGTYTSEAKRAQQILYTRNISHGFGIGRYQPKSSLDINITRNYDKN